MTPSDELARVAKAICKSRTCEGVSCCQWPAQGGRTECPVARGAYDDAARDAIAALRSTLPSPVDNPSREELAKKPYWHALDNGFKYRGTLIFEGGILAINGKGYGDKDGAGYITFKDEELEWAANPEDAEYRVLHLPRSELVAIRRHISECIGPYVDDATETPRVIDNDKDEITVSLNGREIRGWSYSNDDERRQKMSWAHEFAEGWFQAMALHLAANPPDPNSDQRALEDMTLASNVREAVIRECAEKSDDEVVRLWAAWHPTKGFGKTPQACWDIDDAIENAKCETILDDSAAWKAVPVEMRRACK